MTKPHDKNTPERMSETLPMRLTATQKDLIQRAAALSGLSMNDVARVGAVTEARRILRALGDKS